MPPRPIRDHRWEAVSSASELAKLIADPHDHKPVRVPTFPNVERTSILALVGTATTSVASNFSTYGMLCRSPAAGLWYTDGKPMSGYHVFQFGTGASMPAVPDVQGSSMSIGPLLNGTVTLSSLSWATWPGAAVDLDGEYWFWVPKSAYAYFSMSVSADLGASGASVLEIEYTTNFSTKDTSKASVLMTKTADGLWAKYDFGGGFWRPLVLSCTTTYSNTALVVRVDCGCLTGGTPALPTTCVSGYMQPVATAPPEFDTAPAVYKACRINASSLLVKNTTSIMYKEGTVEGMLVPLQTKALDLFGISTNFNSYIADVGSASRYMGLLENGMYTFTVPDASSLAFRDCVLKVSGYTTSQVPLFNLDAVDYVNVFKFADQTSTTATNLTFIHDTHVEFRNTTMLWPVGVSTTPLEEFHRAMVAVQSLPLFYENPTHLAAIANLARLAATRLAPYARPVIAAGLSAARDRILSMAASAIKTQLGKPQVVVRQPTVVKPKVKAGVAAKKKKR